MKIVKNVTLFTCRLHFSGTSSMSAHVIHWLPSTNLYTIGVLYCYWSTNRVLHCSDASWAHALVIFYSAGFSIPLNTL